MTAQQKQNVIPAIVLGTHTMGLGVIRALGRMNVPVVAVYYDSEKDMGYTSKYVTRRIHAPHPESSPDDFVDLLLNLGSNYTGGVLFPVSDETLVTVSKNKPQLSRLYRVACTEWEITQKLIDKKYTYALAESVGVAVPKTLYPTCREDVEDFSHSVEFPCLVKPSQSHLFFARFGRKMVPVSDRDEMIRYYLQAEEAGLEVVLQEIIPGDDEQVVNYNSYFRDGLPIAEFTAQHIRKAPPQFGSPCVAISREIPEVTEPGRKILKALNFYGYSCSEYKLDPRDGVYKLMEVNGRHNLSTLLAVRCGINFPWLHYRHLSGEELPVFSGFTTGVYWIDIARDLGYSTMCLTKGGYSLRRFLKPYFKPHIFAVLDMFDPKPFLKRLVYLFRKAVHIAR